MMRGLAKLATDSESTSNASSGTPKVDPRENQRKQDLHEQQLRFNEEKHEMDMERLGLQLQQAQQTLETKQKQDQEKAQADSEQKAQEQQEQQAIEQQGQQQQQLAHVQQQDTQRNNIMAKAAAMYTDELEPISLSSAAPSALLGTGMGAGAAHAMFPTEATQRYRDLAAKISPEQVQKSISDAQLYKGKVPKDLMEAVSDISESGDKVKFRAPAHVRKTFFKNRALQSNAKRLLGGSGIGLLTGLIAHQAMQE